MTHPVIELPPLSIGTEHKALLLISRCRRFVRLPRDLAAESKTEPAPEPTSDPSDPGSRRGWIAADRLGRPAGGRGDFPPQPRRLRRRRARRVRAPSFRLGGRPRPARGCLPTVRARVPQTDHAIPGRSLARHRP